MSATDLEKEIEDLTIDDDYKLMPIAEKGQMAEKLKRAAPYNMFLTAITDSKPTHGEPLSVTLQEIFDESLGEIESSVQINFVIDIDWLLMNYYIAGLSKKPLLVLYGYDEGLPSFDDLPPLVTAIKINMASRFASSHSKIMLLGYTDGSMRIVISTANLYCVEWCNRTQSLWMSPLLPALPDDADQAAGESVTGFKKDFILYLLHYKVTQLQPWISRIRKSDFSAVNVFFIGSVPGIHQETTGHIWGCTRFGSLLQKYAAPIEDHIPIICQSSSVGSMGRTLHTWLGENIINNFRKDSAPINLRRQLPPFQMIYPSHENVSNSYDGLLCTPLDYRQQFNDRQMWFNSYLYQWKAESLHRSQAIPHMKSYTRVNLDKQCVYWFALTSSNLSKSAWGFINVNFSKVCLHIANYEAGVLFLPRIVTGEDTFPLDKERNGVPAFPIPFDIPLTPYGTDDKPYLTATE